MDEADCFSGEKPDSHVQRNITYIANVSEDTEDYVIEFSDGEWEWKTEDGELVNNGKYSESSDHPGFVCMYADEDSKYCVESNRINDNMLPLYFADDGNIYYPAYMKN